MLTRIDHVMLCVPNLEEGIEAYTRIGFHVYPGGAHTGGATHNAIAFHQEDYLELLTLRDGRPAAALIPGSSDARLSEFLARGGGFRYVAVQSDDLAADVAAMRRHGVDVGDAIEGSRRTPAGQELRWKAAGLGPRNPLPIFFVQHLTPLDERRRQVARARPISGALPHEQYGRRGPLDGESRHAAAGARHPQYRRAGDPGRAGSGLWRLYRFRGPGVRIRTRGSLLSQGGSHGLRIVHDAVASTRAQSVRRSPVGPSAASLGGRARLQRGVDRRASHRALGAAPVAGPRIGPGGFLMPYHHPAELANRVAMLDHMAQGRLNFGVAASGLPSDWAMFNVDGNAGQHREMTREALDIILRLWSDEPEFDYKGKYWHVTKTGTMLDTLRPHIKPLQKPHPPIGVAGVSKGSDTLKLAGERGFWPMSLNLNPTYVGSHWEAVEQGAARSGRTPKRAEWRLVREVFIADTDAEAMRLSAGGMMGRMMQEYFLPLLASFQFTEFLKHKPDVPDSDVTPEYCARHNWLVGSPATVADKLHEIYEEVGGFGTLLLFCFDYSENPTAWRHSIELLAKEVMPRFKGLVPK